MSETVDREFSIIILSYNYARYLPRAIESTLVQRGDDFETIAVDDGSTDSTAQVVQGYCAGMGGRVRYIFQDNQGPGAARNRGIALSRGRYLVFLDSDDAMLPDALHRFRSAFSQGTWVDFVWGGVLNRLSDGTIVSQPSGSITSDKVQNFRHHLGDCLGMKIGAVAVRRRICERVRFPESNRGFEHVVFHAHLLALHGGVRFLMPYWITSLTEAACIRIWRGRSSVVSKPWRYCSIQRSFRRSVCRYERSICVDCGCRFFMTSKECYGRIISDWSKSIEKQFSGWLH